MRVLSAGLVVGASLAVGGGLWLWHRRQLYRRNQDATRLHTHWRRGYSTQFETGPEDHTVVDFNKSLCTFVPDHKYEWVSSCEGWQEKVRDGHRHAFRREMARICGDPDSTAWFSPEDRAKFVFLYERFLSDTVGRQALVMDIKHLLWELRVKTHERAVLVAKGCVTGGTLLAVASAATWMCKKTVPQKKLPCS